MMLIAMTALPFVLITVQFLSISPALALFVLALMTIVEILWLRTYTVQLRSDGVKLYGVWRLRWPDVRTAGYSKVLGLPYVWAKRRLGFAFWIPLYFVGDCNLGEALIAAAPEGHPFRSISLPP